MSQDRNEQDFDSIDPDVLFRRLHLLGLLEPSTGWYKKWYFLLRLEEEISRCRRYGRECALVAMKLGGPGEELRTALTNVASYRLRSTDVPGVLADGYYAIILPETNRSNGEIVAQRLVHALTAFSRAAAVSAYPEDGQEAEELLNLALDALHRGIRKAS